MFVHVMSLNMTVSSEHYMASNEKYVDNCE